MTRLLRALVLLSAGSLVMAQAHVSGPSRGPLVMALPDAGGALPAVPIRARPGRGSVATTPPPRLAARTDRRPRSPGQKRAGGDPGAGTAAADATQAHAAAALAGVAPDAYGLEGPPSISVAVIEGVLQRYGSPLAGQGQMIYDVGRAYGIDPAFCLAFFVHESAAGTRGEAVLTQSMGNIRARAGEPGRDGYRLYTTWEEGVRDWYRLIRDDYLRRWHLRTVAEVVPVYAPSSDANDVAAYISDVQTLVSDWRALSSAGT